MTIDIEATKIEDRNKTQVTRHKVQVIKFSILHSQRFPAWVRYYRDMAEKIDIQAYRNAWLNVPMTLRSLMMFLIGCSTATLGMGQTILPDWMLVAHGVAPSADPPAGDDYYYDRMLNVGGTNTFIGRYEGKSTKKDVSHAMTFTG